MATAAAPFQFFQVLHDPFFWSCFVAWLGSAGHTENRSHLPRWNRNNTSRDGLRRQAQATPSREARTPWSSTPTSIQNVPTSPPDYGGPQPFFDLGDHEDRTIWAMMALATYGLLRCGEITVNPYDRTRYPRRRDWRISDDLSLASIHLPISKSDYEHKGTHIFVASNSSISCPVNAVQQMLHLSPFPPSSSDPLFSLNGIHPISRYVFLRRVRNALSRAGFNGAHYAGHSFRRGGAQSAYDAGSSIDDIQLLGRWKQAQVAHRYFGFTQQKLQSLSAGMATTKRSNPLRFELLEMN